MELRLEVVGGFIREGKDRRISVFLVLDDKVLGSVSKVRHGVGQKGIATIQQRCGRGPKVRVAGELLEDRDDVADSSILDAIFEKRWSFWPNGELQGSSVGCIN